MILLQKLNKRNQIVFHKYFLLFRGGHNHHHHHHQVPEGRFLFRAGDIIAGIIERISDSGGSYNSLKSASTVQISEKSEKIRRNSNHCRVAVM